MERRGHYGTSLLICAFFIAWLGLFQGLLATVVIVGFDHLPDQDQMIPENIVKHRGPTHSLTFAAVVAFITASTVAYPAHFVQQVAIEKDFAQGVMVAPVDIWVFISGTVTVSLIVHIATDALTTGGGYRVEPLWPLSSRTVALGLCNSDNPQYNMALLASGVTAMVAAVWHELYNLVVSFMPLATTF